MHVDKFFAYATDIFAVVDKDGKFKELSPAFEKIVGFPVSQGLLHHLTDFLIPEDVSPTLTALYAAVRGRPWREHRTRFRCRDGSVQWIIWNGSVESSSGDLYAIGRVSQPPAPVNGKSLKKQHDELKTIADELNSITEQLADRKENVKNLEKELSEAKISEVLTQTILDICPTPLIITEMPNGTILACNQALATLFNANLSQLIGQTTPFLNPKDWQSVLKNLQKTQEINGLPLQFSLNKSKSFIGEFYFKLCQYKNLHSGVGFIVPVQNIPSKTQGKIGVGKSK